MFVKIITNDDQSNSSKEIITPAFDLHNIAKTNRVFHKDNISRDITKAYYDSLQTYLDFTNFYELHTSITFFKQPLNYFLLLQKTLKLLVRPDISFINLSTAFYQLGLPTSSDLRLEMNLINALKRYLNRFMTSYFKVLCHYRFYDLKDENILTPGSCLTPFDRPGEAFQCIDGNLFTKTDKGNLNVCLSAKTIPNLFRNIWKIPRPKKEEILKKILKECKKNCSIISYSQKTPDNPYYIRVKDEVNRNYFEFEYFGSKKCFNVHMTEDKVELNYFHTHSLCLHKTTPLISNFLFKATQGNFYTLNSWVSLLASVVSPEYLTKKLYIVTCADDCIDTLLGFLDTIFYYPTLSDTAVMPFRNLKDLSTPALIPEFCTHQASEKKYFCIEKVNQLYNQDALKQIKKLIAGRPVTFKDKILGNINYINKLPIICIATSHRDLTYLKNNFPYIEIPFYQPFKESYSTVTTETSTKIPAEFKEWFLIKLALYGIKNIVDPTDAVSSKQNKIIVKHDAIINEFLSLCCSIKKKSNVFTTAEGLYNAYLYFFSKLYSGSSLGKRQFIKVFKLCGDFEYKRPHTSNSGSNPYAFMCIELKENFKTFVDAKIDSEFLSPDAKDFYEKLMKIDEEVIVDYDELPERISRTTTPTIYGGYD